MHRWILALALVTALVPTGGTAAAAESREAEFLPGPLVRVTDDGVERRPLGLDRFRAGLRDADVVEIQEAVLELAPMSLGISATSGWSGYATAFLQGDATGDGLSEVFVVHQPSGRDPSLRFEVISPPHGLSLWSTVVQGDLIRWTLDVDLTGDGLTDVLFQTATRNDDDTTTWRLWAVRGADGTVAWERTITGATAGQQAGGAGHVVGAAGGVSAAVVPVVGPDADGDGGADVWLNEIDGASAWAGEENALTPYSAGSALGRFSLLSGATGLPVSTAALPAAGTTVVLPGGDLSGDGLADSVASQIHSTPTSPAGRAVVTTISALEGRTGALLWTAANDGQAVGVPVPDLDGDGLADVLVRQTDTLGARSGADGSELWVHDDPLYGVEVPGDIDGVAGHDVLMLDTAHGPDREIRVHSLALRGDTGAAIYDTKIIPRTLPTDGYVSTGFSPVAGDMDGDGVLDTVINSATGPFLGQDTGDIHVISGATGQIHWSRFGEDLAGTGGGDLTGDGRDDVFQIRNKAADGLWDYAALTGANGDEVWSRNYDGSAFVRGRVGHDLGGSGADDVLFLVITEEEDDGGGIPLGATAVTPKTWVDAVDGPTGELLWDAPPESVPL